MQLNNQVTYNTSQHDKKDFPGIRQAKATIVSIFGNTVTLAVYSSARSREVFRYAVPVMGLEPAGCNSFKLK